MRMKQGSFAGAVLLLAALASTAGTKLVGKIFPKPHEEPMVEGLQKEAVEEKIYRDGDVIKTPIGNMEIDGWKLFFDLSGRTCEGDKNYTVRIAREDGCPEEEITIHLNDYFEEVYGHSFDWKSGSTYISIQPNRNAPDTPLSLEIVEETEWATTRKLTYKIEPLCFTSKIRQKPAVYAETDIGTDNIEYVESLRDGFNEFGAAEPLVFIMNVEGGSYDEQEIQLGAELFESGKQEECTNTVYHEFSHGVREQLARRTGWMEYIEGFAGQVFYDESGLEPRIEHSERVADLDNAFWQLRKRYEDEWQVIETLRVLFWIPRWYIENSLCFSIFDESNYINVDPIFGHPDDTPSELFASGMTIFGLYPHEFIRKFEGLPPGVKEIVREAGLLIFDSLENADDGRGKIPLLIPEYDLLKGVLEAGMPKTSCLVNGSTAGL